MKTVVLNCESYMNMGDFYDELSDKLGLPSYFGRNFDALRDCLCELGEEVCLVLKNCKSFEERIGVKFAVLKRVLNDVVRENPAVRVAII